MTFGEMKLELRSRMESLSDLRAGRFINDAYHELTNMYAWPFAVDAASGAAPLSINEVRKVLVVREGTGILSWVSIDVLERWHPGLPDSGAPEFYYLTQTDTTETMATVVNVYPASTNSINVRFIKHFIDLALDANVPLVPYPYHGLIVDMAQLRACRRTPEHLTMVQQLGGAVRNEIQAMVMALMVPSNETEVLMGTANYGWLD